jgi:tetratricopeptide (TPR) repeat protein
MAKSKASLASGSGVGCKVRVPSAGAAGCLLTGRRVWSVRLACAVLAPVVFLVLLEVGLAAAGFGRPATFFVSSGRDGMLTTNHWYIWFQRQTRTTSPHPCLIQAAKPSDTIRLFVLGESAAMGTPNPAFGFARMLEIMLQARFPGQRVEVVNAAMRGIDSHVVASISQECARLGPDLLVVYMGNNEVIGQHGPTTFLGRHANLIGPLRSIRQTRSAQCLRTAARSVAPDEEGVAPSETMESFRKARIALDDPRRETTYRHYRRNLRQIYDNAFASGASVVVATVAVNLKDCPPLASLHRRDLTVEQLQAWESIYRRAVECEGRQSYGDAISGYRQAAALDDHYAELHFRLARCHLALGDKQAAASHFSLARDWDALQFRTDSRLNDIVRETAAEYAAKKVHLVDADRGLAASCADGIAGESLFNDHVHYSFEGDYELARLLLPVAVQTLQQDRGLVAAESADVPSPQECAKRLAFTAWDRLDTVAGIARMLARPPFLDQLDHAQRQRGLEKKIAEATGRIDQAFIADVTRSYEDAIARDRDDWALRYNYANFLYQLQCYPQATPHIQYVVDRFGRVPAFHVLLGYCLAGNGRLDRSIEQFRLARKLDRHSRPIEDAFLWAQQRQQGLTRRASQ